MKVIIGIPKETITGETRVAATPETVKMLLARGVQKIFIEKGAGQGSFIPDDLYTAAGATLSDSVERLYGESNVILKVGFPSDNELNMLTNEKVIVGLLKPYDSFLMDKLVTTKVTGFAMEKLPRISRAQSMDVLSSQANLAGYKSLLVAANVFTKAMPMLMTAAGTLKAARCLIMGVGVAGLQAIATAKRLGCIVEATDVRPETKEQVESLGAKFIEVPLSDEEIEESEGSGGYAKEMSADYQKRQQELVAERVAVADIVITTALIPGKPAPILVDENMVNSMKPGSVIVDLAAEQGGNCPLSQKDKTVVFNNISIVGIANYPALLASDTSALYSKNLANFMELLIDKTSGELTIDRNDEIVAGTLVCLNGESVG